MLSKPSISQLKYNQMLHLAFHFHKVFLVVLVKSESFYYPYCYSHMFKCYHGQVNSKLSQTDLTTFFFY